MAQKFYTAENYDWRTSLGHRIAQVRCGLRRHLDGELTGRGLSTPQWVILMMAARKTSPLPTSPSGSTPIPVR
jgi:hypothetical protein